MSFCIDQSASTRKPGEMQARDENGLFQYAIRDQNETAIIMGLSRARVQQIERSALIKLRRGLKKEWEDLQ